MTLNLDTELALLKQAGFVVDHSSELWQINQIHFNTHSGRWGNRITRQKGKLRGRFLKRGAVLSLVRWQQRQTQARLAEVHLQITESIRITELRERKKQCL